MSSTPVFTVQPPPVERDPDAPVEIASIGRRAAALMVDQVVVFLVAFVCSLIALVGAYGGEPRPSSGTPTATQLVALLVSVAYFGLLPGRKNARNGQTPGKRLLGVRITRGDGMPITMQQSLIRATALTVPGMILIVGALALDISAETGPLFALIALVVVLAVGFADVVLAPLFGEHRRTFRDRIARTVVLRANVEGLPIAPVAIPPRPKTSATKAVGIVGSILAVACIALTVIGLTIADGDSDSSSSSFSSSAPAPEPATQAASARALDTIRAADFSEGAVATNVTDLALTWAGCLGSTDDPSSCSTESDVGFPDRTLDPISISAFTGGEDIDRQISIIDPGSIGSMFLVYDRNGIAWGFRYTSEESTYESFCVPVWECGNPLDHPSGDAFMQSQGNVDQLIAEHERALYGG